MNWGCTNWWTWFGKFHLLTWLVNWFSWRSPLWPSFGFLRFIDFSWLRYLMAWRVLLDLWSVGIVMTLHTFFWFSRCGSNCIIQVPLILLQFNVILNRLLDSTFMITLVLATLPNRLSTGPLRLFNLTNSPIFTLFLLNRNLLWSLRCLFGVLFCRSLLVLAILRRTRNHSFLHIIPFPFHSPYFLFISILLFFQLNFNLFLLTDLFIFIELRITETFIGFIVGFVTLQTKKWMIEIMVMF